MNCTARAAAEQGPYWDFLSCDSESFRYAAIANAVHKITAGAGGKPITLFDAGCGAGILRLFLPPHVVGRYVGADMDQTALAKGGMNLRSSDHQIHASLDDQFKGLERFTFDVVVFNEVLYYTRDPIASMTWVLRRLRPGGHVIVSIHLKSKPWALNNRCLRRVRRYLEREATISYRINLNTNGSACSIIVASIPQPFALFNRS